MLQARALRRTAWRLPHVRAVAGRSWKLCQPPKRDDQVLLGAVSYDPSISTIWERMRDYMNTAGCPFDFVLHTNYEQQVAALLEGRVDIAWNGPIAHVLTQSLAGEGASVSLGMRDCDRDFVSVAVARRDAGVGAPAGIAGRVVATGASDSPQAHLVPLQWLRDLGVEPGKVVPFDIDLGKHGDTALGEVAAMEALVRGEADVALLSDMMWQRGLGGALPSVDGAKLQETVAVVPGEGPPLFDHCQFDALASGPAWKRESFTRALFAMDMSNPAHCETMRLEGIKRQWMPNREDGYAVAVRALRGRGFEVQAFERSPTVGGLWTGNYLNFGIQVPKQLYEFPDFPMPVEWGKYATGPEVQQYIDDFADAFKLRDNVRINTTVKSVAPAKDGGWNFVTEEAGGHAPKEVHFDYCVVATGLYGSADKFVPEVPGSAEFQGSVVHSSDFRKAEQAEGKRVVVVGGGKSAVDCAVGAAQVPGTQVTLLSRQAHWPTPRKIADLIPFQYVFLSRLGQALVCGLRGPLPGTPEPMPSWHRLGWPLMEGAFKAVELLFAAQFRNLRGASSPLGKVSVVDDFYGFAHVLDYSFRDLVRSGAVAWRHGAVEALSPTGVTLQGGGSLDADVVVFATGFAKDYSIFPQATREALGVEEDGLWLYRHTLPLGVPDLAFVGSELATISNISSYGLQAEWLARQLAGDFPLPSAADMAGEVEGMKAWKRGWMPKTASRASLVLLHQTHFHDRLLKDMGVQHRRKGWLAELLMPYQSMDYNGIICA